MNTIQIDPPGRWQPFEALIGTLTSFWRQLRQTPGKLVALALALFVAIVCAPGAWIPSSPTTPDGLLGLELPGTRDGVLGALALLDEGSPGPGTIDRRAVEVALGFDFGVILGYSIALHLVVGWLATRRGRFNDAGRVHLVDRFAPRAPFVAAAFDVARNLLLWTLLELHAPYGAAGLLASLATVCSLSSFSLLGFVVLYAVYAGMNRAPRSEPDLTVTPGPRPGPPTSRETLNRMLNAARIAILSRTRRKRDVEAESGDTPA
jgi:hypothetical protein